MSDEEKQPEDLGYRYLLCAGITNQQLTQVVSDNMSRGWKLHGDTFVSTTGFFQAMTYDVPLAT